jgi:hypothetical protein
MKRIKFLLLAMMLGFGQIFAQRVYHEFTVGGSVGASGAFFKQKDNKQLKIFSNPDVGGGLDLQYVLHFSRGWSFVLGASAHYYGLSYEFGSLLESSSRNFAIPQYNSFILNSEISDYSERYDAIFVRVPVLFGYETKGLFAKWYCRAGVELSIPVYKYSNVSIGKLVTTGYTEYDDYTWGSQYPFLGFGSQENVKLKSKLKFSLGIDGYVETGVKVPVHVKKGKNFNIYVGAFAQVNILTNNHSGDNDYLIGYSTEESRSTDINDHILPVSLTDTRYMSKGRMFMIGGVIRFGFDFSGRKNMPMLVHAK